MAIRTALREVFGLQHPIVLAPMASVSGGQLAAVVSNAGGLGLVGGGYGDPNWLREELSLARNEAERPWGVGLITWHATHETVELALSYEPHAFMLSFGDPAPYVPTIKEGGCQLICQVHDVEGALAAEAAGADFIVAQGTEAGGHGADRSTLPLVLAVVDAVAPTPVLAAGGIADGRGCGAHAWRPGSTDGNSLLRGHRSARSRKCQGAHRGGQGSRYRANAGFRHCTPACVASTLHRTRHTQSLYGTLAGKGE